MIRVRKINDKLIGITDEAKSPKEKVFTANFVAHASENNVAIESDRPSVKFAAKYEEIEVNGVAYGSAVEAAEALMEFVGSFKSGGSSPSPTPSIDPTKPVLFFDYDGTLVASYTIAEAQALQALPEQPTHEYLTGDGWTHTLEEVRATISSLHVGAMYRTTDGKTRAFVTLTRASGLDLPICFTVTGTATIRVDWGDGQTQDVTTTSTLTHSYAVPGDYQITLERIAGTGTYGIGGGSMSTTFIGGGIANYKRSVTGVHIGNNAILGAQAVNGCYSLTSVVIPSNVTNIANIAFGNCFSLASIIIPSSVTKIEQNAFVNCYSLTSVVIPSSVTNIGYSVFGNCPMTSIIIPSSITTISSNLFDGCNSLTSVVIPSSVTTIDMVAFNCRSLNSVIIPSSVTAIGANAFSSFAMKEFVFPIYTPPSAGGYMLGTLVPLCKIYVPDESVEAYKTATNWVTYANCIYPISERP